MNTLVETRERNARMCMTDSRWHTPPWSDLQPASSTPPAVDATHARMQAIRNEHIRRRSPFRWARLPSPAHLALHCARGAYGEIWRDMGRYGEMWDGAALGCLLIGVREAKVAQLSVAVGGEDDVLELDVAMHHARARLEAAAAPR